jgi:hypothetical protein
MLLKVNEQVSGLYSNAVSNEELRVYCVEWDGIMIISNENTRKKSTFQGTPLKKPRKSMKQISQDSQ